jgi:hypothetical protein
LTALLLADGKPGHYHQAEGVIAEGWYRSLALSQLTPETFLAALEEIAPRTSSQLDERAAAVSRRLPELFARP